MRKRAFDTFRMRFKASIENFAVRSWDGLPTFINRLGQIWFNKQTNSLYVSGGDETTPLPLRLLNNSPRWQNVSVPMVVGTTSVTGNPTWESFAGNAGALVFNGASMQAAQCTFVLPHNYAMGTDIFPYIHWVPKNENETGTVRWCFDILTSNGYGEDSFDSPFYTLAVEQSAQGIKLEHLTTETAQGFYEPKLEPDTVVVCKVYRDGGHPNDTAGEVYGLVAGLHVQVDDIGTPNRGPNFFIT